MQRTTLTRSTLMALALLAGAGSVHAQGAELAQRAGASQPNYVSLVTTLDGLAAQYRGLAATATGVNATTADRRALAKFVRLEIVPQLKTDIVDLYTTFDSLVGGGYAVPATLVDLDAIDALSKEVAATALTRNRAQFDVRAYALSQLLDNYFAKTQMLVLPFVIERTQGALVSFRPSVVERLLP